MDVWDYLKSVGFVGDADNGENERYMGKAVDSGQVHYVYEYQLYDGNWRNKTESGFYMWSGLGDRQSYALFTPCDESNIDLAKVIVSVFMQPATNV